MDLFTGERKKLPQIRVSFYDSITVGKTAAVVTAELLRAPYHGLCHIRDQPGPYTLAVQSLCCI